MPSDHGRALLVRSKLGLLRIGALLVLGFPALTGCATAGGTPTPPSGKLPRPPLEELTKVDLLTDLTARIELPGVSVLPPRGRMYQWIIGYWRHGNGDGVTIMANARGDRVLIASVTSTPTPHEEWTRLRSYGPAVFQETVRQAVTEGLVGLGRTRTVDVQQPGQADGTCVRYRVELDHTRHGTSGTEGPARLLATGKLCLHPDSPRFVMLVAGQSIPAGVAVTDSDDNELSPFLDSLQFRPIGVARTP